MTWKVYDIETGVQQIKSDNNISGIIHKMKSGFKDKKTLCILPNGLQAILSKTESYGSETEGFGYRNRSYGFKNRAYG